MARLVSRELRAAGLKVALEQAKQALSLGHADRVEEKVSAIEGWVRTIVQTPRIAKPSENDKTPPVTLRGVSPQLQQRS